MVDNSPSIHENAFTSILVGEARQQIENVVRISRHTNALAPSIKAKEDIAAATGVFNYQINKGVYTPEIVRIALGNKLWNSKPDWNEQAATDIILHQLPQLHIESMPICEVNNSHYISYYGRRINITSPINIENASVFEINVGLLGIKNSAGQIIGFLDVHPASHKSGLEPISVSIYNPTELFRQNLGRDIPGVSEKDIQDFMKDHNELFKSLFPYINFGTLPLEGKFYIWKCLSSSSPEESIPLHLIMSHYGSTAVWLIQALEGKPELINSFGRNLESLVLHADYLQPEARPALTELDNMVNTAVEIEHFQFEAAATIIPPNEIVSEDNVRRRSNFILPYIRTVVQESVQSIAKVKDNHELRLAVNYHHGALASFKNIVRFIYEKNRDIDTQLRPFSPDELKKYEKRYAQFPHSGETYRLLVARFIGRAITNQKGISVEERKKWLQDFYKYVISIGVYHEKAAAYADTRQEIERLVNGFQTLCDEGVGDDANKIRLPSNCAVASLACGDALRVDGPAFEQIGRLRPDLKPREFVGIDMMDQHDRWTGITKFIRCEAERIIAEHPELKGHFQFVMANGSPFNNMDLAVEQLPYFLAASHLMASNGIFMYEMGSDIPAPELNERLQRMKDFNALFPEKIFGSMPINKAYAAMP